MNKKVIIIILSSLLAILVYYQYFYNPYSFDSEVDFAISDTSLISKVIIEKGEDKITIERKETGWMINQFFEARNGSIKNLMKTLMFLQVKSSAPRLKINDLIQQLEQNGTKVDVFAGRKLLKTFYVGKYSSSHAATYLMLAGSEKPMLVYFPGISNNLNARFVAKELFWKNKTVFAYKPMDIQEVVFLNYEDSLQSFVIKKTDSIFLMKDIENKNIKQHKITQYLTYFIHLEYEKIAPFSKHQKDSILGTKAINRIKIVDTEQNIKEISCFSLISASGKEDLDRLYAYYHNDNEFLEIKYYVFDPIFKTKKYFLTD